MYPTIVHQFIVAHGGNPVKARYDQLLFLLPDGASYSGNEFVTFREPPTEPVPNLRARIRYWEVATLIAEDDFKRQQKEFNDADEIHLLNPSNCPPSPEWANQHLEKLADKVEKCRAKRDELKAELDATLDQLPEAQAARAAEAARQEAVEAVRQRKTERQAITI